MDRDDLTHPTTPETEAAAEGYRPLPGFEEDLEDTEALKQHQAPTEIFRPREPGPHPRP
jgi:hypothetical protein